MSTICASGDAPRVVVVGGGHGQAASLRAARRYAGEVVAVVSTADDGGSSGRLRAELGIPAPGDVRLCLSALASESTPWPSVLEHRFEHGSLAGHPVGNLLLAGLADSGVDFVDAIARLGELLGVVGRVVPATTASVELHARSGSSQIRGEAAVGDTEGIGHVMLVPQDPPACGAAVDAIISADQVVVGPGSLYTSVLAAAIVPGIRDALAATDAPIVYVCNLRAEMHETAGFDVAAHVRALLDHGIEPDTVICQQAGMALGCPPVRVLEADVASSADVGHDPARLAAVLEAVLRAYR